jgi:hypothetical protein
MHYRYGNGKRAGINGDGGIRKGIRESNERVRFARAIGPDNGCEIRISKEKHMVSLVGLEIWERSQQPTLVWWACKGRSILKSSRRMSFPIVVADRPNPCYGWKVVVVVFVRRRCWGRGATRVS